jgi:aminoglycoside 3-N-acetyltransferase
MYNNLSNKGFKNQLFSIFPHIEILIRIIYWKNIFFIKFISRIIKCDYLIIRRSHKKEVIDFNKIIDFLKSFGIYSGATLLVHSSYDSIKYSGKLPKDIVNDLLDLIGPDGNLVMPANRVYDETKQPIVFNVNKTRIWSGALPLSMLLRKDSEISRFPINSVVIIGKDAKEMVNSNIKEEFSTPCGLNSAWYQCYLKNAFILGLGIDLTHSLTMTHVVEDSWEHEWPIKDWYEAKQYQIIDNNFNQVINVRQRKEKWGKYYFAERKLAKDLSKASILKTYIIEGVDIQLIRSQELINFLRSRNANGYPFYGVSRFKKP